MYSHKHYNIIITGHTGRGMRREREGCKEGEEREREEVTSYKIPINQYLNVCTY